jgi:hypothetical protein
MKEIVHNLKVNLIETAKGVKEREGHKCLYTFIFCQDIRQVMVQFMQVESSRKE